MPFNNNENCDNADEVSGGDERKEEGRFQVSEAGAAAEFSQDRWTMGGDSVGAVVVVVVMVEMTMVVVLMAIETVVVVVASAG